MTRWRKQGFSKKSDQYVRNSRLLANRWSGYRTADEHNYFCEKSPVIPHIEADDVQTINHDGLVYVPEPAGSDVSVSFKDLDNSR